jgi:ComF family protein
LQRRGNKAASPEIKCRDKTPGGIVQTVEHALGEIGEHRGEMREALRRPVAMPEHRVEIENLLHMKTFLAQLLDTLLPPSCLACDAPVPLDGQFCAACFRRVNFLSAPFCDACGVPLPYAAAAGTDGRCRRCELSPPVFTQARAALRYDDVARALIMPFKYADRTDTARGIARLMLRPGHDPLARADLLVPVPLHPARLRWRRYNQAALLASELARLTRRTCVLDALCREKATAPLERLGLAGRQAELQDAIVPRTGFTATNRTVLLIDDVMTSGTTANACAAALRAAGAARVDVLTAARVADPSLA